TVAQATRWADQPDLERRVVFMIPNPAVRVVGLIAIDACPSPSGGSSSGSGPSDATLADVFGLLAADNSAEPATASARPSADGPRRRASARLDAYAPAAWNASRIPADLVALADELEEVVACTRRAVAAISHHGD